MVEQVFGFGDIAKVLVLGAMPWLNYLKPLRWHLKASDFNPVPIFNAVATICAAVLSFIYYDSPDPAELFVPPLLGLLPLFIIPAAVYFSLFLVYRESVAKGARKWPFLVAFVVYVTLFCSLAVIAGNLEIRRTFKVVWGEVTDMEGKGVAGASVDFAADGEPVVTDVTTVDGSFKVAVNRDARVDELLVNKEGFQEFHVQISGIPKPRYRIKLEPE